MDLKFEIGEKVSVALPNGDKCPGQIGATSITSFPPHVSYFVTLQDVYYTSSIWVEEGDLIKLGENPAGIHVKCDCGAERTGQPAHSRWCSTEELAAAAQDLLNLTY